MASQGIDADAYTTPFMLTQGMHRDVYPAVNPATNPALRADSKVVIVTGAGGGLGNGIAKSWAAANAKGIVLVGRNYEALKSTAAELPKTTKVIAVAADVSSPADCDAVLQKTIAEFGQADVLINAHGAMNVGPIGQIEPGSWWANFVVNVQGTYNIISSFIKATGGKGTVVNLVTVGASFLAPGLSGYSASKLAVIKLGECLDLEQPGLRVFSVHPGMVEAENGRGMVVDAFTPFAKDKAALTGGLTLYLSTPRADYLKGGYLHANWDVTELEAHKQEIAEKKLIKLAFLNGPLAPGGYKWSS